MASLRPRSTARQLGLLTRLLATCTVAGSLVAGLALPAVALLGISAKRTVQDFNDGFSAFTVPAMSRPSQIYDADGGLIATVFDRNRVVVPGNRMAPVMRRAIVDIEDYRFYQHGAVDPKGVLRALYKNASSDGISQGASTLTQQFAKNAMVEAAGDDESAVLAAQEQSLSRKVRDIRYAISLERTLTKDQILTDYLNIVYFGEGAYGIEAAAERYFSVHAANLNLPQASLLAGLVQSPTAYDPVLNPVAAKARRDTVLGKMAQYGTISRTVERQAVSAPLGLRPSTPRQGCVTARHGEGFFCDYVHQVVLRDRAFGRTVAERQTLWLRGGLQIRTTLDPTAQRALQRSLTDHVYASDRAAAATTIVQPGTGRIVAMGQSRPYGTAAHHTEINLNVGVAMGGGLGFPTGSTFKPIVAAAALENGYTTSQSYPAPYSMPWPEMRDCAGGHYREGQDGEVHNDSHSLVGPFRMPEAMALSVNTYFARLEADAGLCDSATMAARLGVTTQAGGEKIRVVPSMTLGTNDLTPLQMANVYAAFAAHGRYCTPTAITSVTTADHRRIAVPQPHCTQAMAATTADTITGMLKGVVEDGTGRPAGLADRASAGKTGTTDGSKQVWFVGYTPQLSGATVVSDSVSPRDLDGQSIGGSVVGQAFGGTLAGPIWRDAMEGALAGVPPTDFSGG